MDIFRVIVKIKLCIVYDIYLEFEFFVCICIILVNIELLIKIVNLDFNIIDESFLFVIVLLRGKLYF